MQHLGNAIVWSVLILSVASCTLGQDYINKCVPAVPVMAASHDRPRPVLPHRASRGA